MDQSLAVVTGPSGTTAYGSPSTAGQNIATTTTGANFDLGSAPIQYIVPTSDILVTLPSAIKTPGRSYSISNQGDNSITLRSHADDDSENVLVLFPGQEAVLVSSGVSGSGVGEGYIPVLTTPGASSVQSQTLSDDLELGDRSAIIQLLDPAAAARTVSLPDADDFPGIIFSIRNTGDGEQALTVRIFGGATLAVLRPGEVGYFHSDSSTWTLLEQVTRVGVQSIAMTGDVALEDANGSWLVVTRDDTGATRNLDLPPPASNKGRLMIIRATGGTGAGDTITVRQNDGSALGAGVVLAGSSGVSTLLAVCDGVEWTSLGAFSPISNSF